jgi:hypothetical protein
MTIVSVGRASDLLALHSDSVASIDFRFASRILTGLLLSQGGVRRPLKNG